MNFFGRKPRHPSDVPSCCSSCMLLLCWNRNRKPGWFWYGLSALNMHCLSDYVHVICLHKICSFWVITVYTYDLTAKARGHDLICQSVPFLVVGFQCAKICQIYTMFFFMSIMFSVNILSSLLRIMMIPIDFVFCEGGPPSRYGLKDPFSSGRSGQIRLTTSTQPPPYMLVARNQNGLDIYIVYLYIYIYVL